MSLALAMGLGASSGRIACQWPSCRSEESTRAVRLLLPGRRASETFHLCNPHRDEAIADGVVEGVTVRCLVPRCTFDRFKRGLCAHHAAQVKDWPAGKAPVSNALAASLATERVINPRAVPLGELAGDPAPVPTPAPVEVERAPIVPAVVMPTTPPAMPHLPSLKMGQDQAAAAICSVLAGAEYEVQLASPALADALYRLGVRLGDDTRAAMGALEQRDEWQRREASRALQLSEASARIAELEAQQAPKLPAWRRYRVSLCGHVALGEVEARRTASEGLELRDGTLIGPAAIFQAIPVVEPPPLPRPAVGLVVMRDRCRAQVVGMPDEQTILFDDDAWMPAREWTANRIGRVEGLTYHDESIPF